jgi:muramidase (phage lysozyme)
MDYADNYKQTISLADKLREAQTQKPRKGFAERVQEFEQVDQDLTVTVARYLDGVRDMFKREEQTQKDRASEIENYLTFKDGSPMPKRNPSYWENAPLLAPITAAETDENVRAILETIKEKESSGNYTVQNQTPGQTASGAYGYTNGTWRMMTEKYGIGTEYKSAKEAPPEVQDIIAANNVREILLENNNDITKVPVIWYTGNAQGKISQKALDVNNGLTPAEYQNDWMRRYNKMLGTP